MGGWKTYSAAIGFLWRLKKRDELHSNSDTFPASMESDAATPTGETRVEVEVAKSRSEDPDCEKCGICWEYIKTGEVAVKHCSVSICRPCRDKLGSPNGKEPCLLCNWKESPTLSDLDARLARERKFMLFCALFVICLTLAEISVISFSSFAMLITSLEHSLNAVILSMVFCCALTVIFTVCTVCLLCELYVLEHGVITAALRYLGALCISMTLAVAIIFTFLLKRCSGTEAWWGNYNLAAILPALLICVFAWKVFASERNRRLREIRRNH